MPVLWFFAKSSQISVFLEVMVGGLGSERSFFCKLVALKVCA